MKTILSASLLSLATIFQGMAAEAPKPRPTAAAGIGRQAPEAGFTDVSGKVHQLSSFVGQQPFTVIAVTSPGCPLSLKFAPTLAAMEDEWKAKGVQFLYTGAISSDPPGSLADLAARHGMDGPATADATQSLARSLRPESTTEVFILDRSRTLHYRGAVDDQYGIGYQKDQPANFYLRDALQAVTANQPPRVAATTAPGCALDAPPPAEENAALSATAAGPTWHREVSRIIQRNCQECHRPGGTGPFEMMRMEDVTGNAAMIRKVINKGLMPPWFAAPQDGDHAITWSNDRALPDADRETLLAWLAGDRAAGEPADAPVPKVWPAEWVLGTPDAIVELPSAVEVQATGRMKYQYREVTTNYPEDKWVTGLEVRPTALAQVHHVLIFAAAPGEKPVVNGDNFFAAYVPGSSAVTYPEGYAKKLPAGSRLIFQLHYTPNGTATEDRTRLGLKFSASPPQHEVHVAAAKQTRFSIPPGAAAHEVKGSLPVVFDAQILSFMPHMHMRGKAFRYDMVDPSGERRELLNVPNYDFNWQLLYRAAEPVLAARGSRIESTAWFDNSAENPNNPDPTKTVRWGDQTEDEMMIGYMEYVKAPTESAEKTAAADAPVPETRLALTPKALGLLGRRLDTDGDKRVSLKEAGPAFEELHRRLDLDQDGFVTRDEARAAAAAAAAGGGGTPANG